MSVPPDTSADAAPPLLGALDLGTNNCRLLIARPRPGAGEEFEVVGSFSRLVRLGEGLAQHGVLQDPAMARTLEALSVCAQRLAAQHLTAQRLVGTEACRRARNGSEFLEQVKARTGLEIEIISGDEEARLAMIGCLPLVDPQARQVLIFDIGGGSTEIIWLERETRGALMPRDHVSLPLGVVHLAEAHGGGALSAAQYLQVMDTVMNGYGPFFAKHEVFSCAQAGTLQVIGCSGTVTTLGGLKLGLARYRRELVDGLWLEVREARRLASELRRLSHAARADLPCVGLERADLIVAGCALLEGLLQLSGAEKFRIGDRGVREGILYELAAQHARPAAAGSS